MNRTPVGALRRRCKTTLRCQLKTSIESGYSNSGIKIDKWRATPLRIRILIRTRLYDCPSNTGRSRCQTAKSRAQPRPREVTFAHAIAAWIQVVIWVEVCRSCFPLAVWRRAGTRRRLSKSIKPLFGLIHARHGRTHDAPTAPSERRRGGGQSGVGAWRTHSSPH